MKVTEEQLKKLDACFPEDALEWRVMNQGTTVDKNTGEKKPWAIVFVYITSRGLQDRLDEAVGRENWQNVVKEVTLQRTITDSKTKKQHEETYAGFLCGISIKIDNEMGGDWVTKWDGANMSDTEGFKGGISGAEKRAGVQWGIGRYLYDKAFKDSFAKFCHYGEHKYMTRIDGAKYYWNPPAIPSDFRVNTDINYRPDKQATVDDFNKIIDEANVEPSHKPEPTTTETLNFDFKEDKDKSITPAQSSKIYACLKPYLDQDECLRFVSSVLGRKIEKTLKSLTKLEGGTIIDLVKDKEKTKELVKSWKEQAQQTMNS